MFYFVFASHFETQAGYKFLNKWTNNIDSFIYVLWNFALVAFKAGYKQGIVNNCQTTQNNNLADRCSSIKKSNTEVWKQQLGHRGLYESELLSKGQNEGTWENKTKFGAYSNVDAEQNILGRLFFGMAQVQNRFYLFLQSSSPLEMGGHSEGSQILSIMLILFDIS